MMRLKNSGGEGGSGYYYGWVIVAVMAVTGAVSMGMGSLNFGLFIKPMGDDLGIGRAMFGWAQTARMGASSATSPLIGWLLDRYGSRVMLPVAALATGLALIGLSQMTSSWHLIVLFVVMGVVGMSGPGALVTTVPVLKWFVRNRGKAVAFVGLGIPFGALLFIPLTQVLINEIGWRGAWIVLAIIGICVIVPLGAIFIRRQPEDMGMEPDGGLVVEEVTGDGMAVRRVVEEVSWTVREAMRTTTFWRLVIVFSMVQMATGTVALHRIAAFMDRGMDPTLISFATAFDAVAAGVSTFGFGMLVRYVPGRFLGAVGFSMLAGASVLTIYANTLPVMFVSMAVFGVGIGGMMFLNNYIWADYFGRHYIGGIRGMVNPINLVVGGIGAPAAGYVRDITGTYDPAWWVGVGLMSGAALLMVLTGAPRKPGRQVKDTSRGMLSNRR